MADSLLSVLDTLDDEAASTAAALPTPFFPESADQAQIASTQVLPATVPDYPFPVMADDYTGQGYDGCGPRFQLDPRSLDAALYAVRTLPRLTDQQLWKLMDSGICNLFFDFINCSDAPDGPKTWVMYEAQLDFISELLQGQLEHFRYSTTVSEVMLAELKMGPIVQVVRLFELTSEEKQRPGMVHWHGELPEEITHEGWMSDGVHTLHAWFHRACFFSTKINLPAESNRGTASTVVHEKAVVELLNWDYHGFGTGDLSLHINPKPVASLDPDGLYSG